MCLLGLGFQIIPGCPIALLANREEAYSRATSGPRVERSSREHRAWLGGIDLVAGGTWLGINDRGLVVAVTNRNKREIPSDPRSRGLLCRTLLAFDSTGSAVDAGVEHLNSACFAGCNLLIADATSAAVIEAGDDLQVTMLSAGLHFLTNASLNDPQDRRIARVRAELSNAVFRTPTDWINAARQVCPMTATRDEPAICLEGQDRGTVSSTIVTLPNQRCDSEYWYAAGPPSRTPYTNQSRLLRELLEGPVRAVATHSIQLRGPWRYQTISRAASVGEGRLNRLTDDLPAPGVAQLPTSWKQLLGDFRGRVAFLRRFHRPDNLDPGEMVLIRLEGLSCPAAVSMNGHDLGTIVPESEPWSCDITPLLKKSNEIRIELNRVDPPEKASQVQLWHSVSLEILAD